jgi:hypothetical protein
MHAFSYTDSHNVLYCKIYVWGLYYVVFIGLESVGTKIGGVAFDEPPGFSVYVPADRYTTVHYVRD